MPGRNKSLITRNGIPDPQAYNPQTGQWESFVGVSWGKTVGGLYVPIRVDDQGRQEVTLSGPIVVKQEVVLARGIRTGEHKNLLDKPPEARGLHLFCRVFGRTGTFGAGQGMSLACFFNRSNPPSLTSYGLRVITDTSTSMYAGHHIFIGPDFVGLGDARGEYAIVKVSPMVLTTNLNFWLIITGTFEAGEGFDTEVTAVWVR